MSDDTDDQIHESSLLASAYLDGEATPDERALVETSADTLGEVDAFSQLRTVLAATAPTASLSEREAHLAGALDVWARMSDLERSGEATPSAGVDAAAAAAVLTPTSTSEGRRARGDRGRNRARSFGASQWLLGAAATLVVIAGVAAVVRGILDEDPATNDLAVEQSADDGIELSEVEANEAAEVGGRNVGTELIVDDPESIADEAQSDPDGEGGLFAEEEAMEEAESAPEADVASTAAEQPAPPAEIDLVELETPEALADFGFLAVRSAIPGIPAAEDVDAEPPIDSCEAEFGLEKRLGPARYRGEDVLVGVDTDNDIVFAYTDDIDDGCTLVDSVSLPPPPDQP